MKIQVILEVSERYINAYEYYQKAKRKYKNMSRDALISQIARMFGMNDIKRFHSYVLSMER